MNDNSNEKQNNVHIEQINPQEELSEIEKTALRQYSFEKEEELSKTTKFKLLNSKNKNNNDFELPKRKISLTDTIKIKISDLRAKVDETLELPNLKKKKSLYDTVIIKLDDLINHHNALKIFSSKKVTSIEETAASKKKKFHLFKPKDISKLKNFTLNVDSEEFGRQLYNLNKIALINLSNQKNIATRKSSPLTKLNRVEKVHISKTNYLKYQQKLNKFAINKLYYKFAPKETKKYKIYKYSVMLSSIIFFITSAIIINWFIQGVSINNLSNALTEDTPIKAITDEGTLIEEPPVEENNEENKKTSLYWKYLNTPLSSVDFTELLKENKDTVGWLIVNNTNINYPVVQTKDNDYYLKHAFDKSKNSAGWVFADFRDDFENLSQNTVIYGHGRKDKVMFGSLNDSLNAKWYTNEDNQIIQLSTIKYNTMWQIFSIYKIQAESYYISTDFTSDSSFETFINTMKERSIYDFNVDVTKTDKLLTLSTCFDNKGIRTVVQAKLVKIQER